MNFSFFDALGIVSNVIDMLNNVLMIGSGPGQASFQKKKIRHLPEKAGSIFLVAALVLLFVVFQNPLPLKHDIRPLIIISFIGIFISLIFFLILYCFGKYYFKNIFQWLFFSVSAILFFTALVFCIYFRSGIFI